QGPLWGQYGNTFDNTNTTFTGPTTSFVTRLTSNFTPTLMNEFVASYTDDHIYLSNQSKVVGLPSGGIDLNPLFANGLGGKIPAFSVGNTAGVAYGSGGFSVDTGYFPWKNANPTTTGNPFADLLTSQIGTYTQNEAAIYFYDRYKIFEPFFQDDWRITKKLTLNLGLRWSVFGRYQEKHDHEFNFSEASYELAKAPSLYNFNDPNYSGLLNITPGTNIFNGLSQCGNSNPTVPGVSPGTTGCMKNKWMNPGPRLGFAYDPFGDGK